jgi:ABC-type sugar transport system substrate-binding protein
MIIKTATWLALAAACLATAPAARAQTGGETVVVTPPARVDPGDANWDPQRNLI